MFKKVLFILMALSLIVPFAYAGERVVTVGGNQATRPITDFGINVVDVYYVDSVNGDDGRRGLSPETAVATLDYAISLTTINQGDIIYLMPNSDETISAAGGVTVDMAGVRIIGLGDGADRPTFTFSATTSTMLFTAASTSIENVILVPSVDNVASAIVVSAADVSLDIEVRDASATVEFIRAILTTAAADNLTIRAKIRGYIAGTAGVTPIQLVGVDTARIYVDYYGEASTAVINFITTACLDIQITGLFWNDNVALTKNVIDTEGNGEWLVQGWDGKGGYFFTGSDAIALAAGGNTGVQSDVTAALEADGLDHLIALADGAGSAPVSVVTDSILAKIMGDDTTAVATTFDNTTDSLEALGNQVADTNLEARVVAANVTDLLDHLVKTGDGTAAYPASVASESILGYIMGIDGDPTDFDEATDSLEAIGDQVDNTNLESRVTAALLTDALDHLAKTADGVGVYPESVVADSILAKILGDDAAAVATTYDNQTDSLEAIGNKTTDILADTAAMQPVAEMAVASSSAVLANGGTIFTIAGGPIEVLSLVSVSQTVCDGTAATLQWSADPTEGAAITFSGACASLTAFAAGGAVVLNMTALDTAPDLSVVAVSLGPVRTRTIIISAGIITTVVGTGPTTGAFIHYLRYRPLGPGVTVTGT